MSSYQGARAVVVGGSIGGLTTALLLRDLGFEVDVFERSATSLDGRGGGIVLQSDTVRWFVERSAQDLGDLCTSTDVVQYLDRANRVTDRERQTWSYTYWSAFYRALLTDFGTDRYHVARMATDVTADAESATVRFSDGSSVTADLVVFADGITSTGRGLLGIGGAPEYSGYVGWRGAVPEDELTKTTFEILGGAVTYGLGDLSHMIAYPIPSEAGTGIGNRLMNYVWYRNVAEGDELADLTTDRDGRHCPVSMHPGKVRQQHLDELLASAALTLPPALAEVVERTTDPYLQVVLDTRAERMAIGRVVVIGDAAFAARPHAAAGTAKAAADAWALATHLGDAAGDIPRALTAWEPDQLRVGHDLIDRVQAMGRHSQVDGTWDPGDPFFQFGLYGPGLQNRPERASS